MFVIPSVFEDVLKVSVIERYGGNTIANGFISGFGIKIQKHNNTYGSLTLAHSQNSQMSFMYGFFSSNFYFSLLYVL